VTTLRSAICCHKSICRLSITFVHPTQGVEAFGNISSLLCTFDLHAKNECIEFEYDPVIHKGSATATNTLLGMGPWTMAHRLLYEAGSAASATAFKSHLQSTHLRYTVFDVNTIDMIRL